MPAIFGIENGPFVLILVYVLLLGGAILTARRAGPGGVRRLFSGVLHWRIGWLNWSIIVGAIPVATIVVAAVTGTYTGPSDGWLAIFGDYLFLTFIFGALIVNVFEETAWQGLVQRNLTRRYGLLKASWLTAVPFAAVHLPSSFVGDVTTSEALVASVFLIVVAPVMRYVMGRTDHATGGSLLAVGVMHASFNASGKLGVVVGDWQYAGGLVIVAALLLVSRRTPQTFANGGTVRGHHHRRTTGRAPCLVDSRASHANGLSALDLVSSPSCGRAHQPVAFAIRTYGAGVTRSRGPRP